MTEKKVNYQTNEISFPYLKFVMGEGPSLNPSRGSRKQAGSEIKKPDIEMETIVSKLITHLKNNHK